MAQRAPRPDDEALLTRSRGTAAEDQALLDSLHAELRGGFEALASVGPAVSVFGSARAAPGSGEYELARATARELGRRGFAVITGGAHGIMEAANRGAREAGAPSIGLVTGEAAAGGSNRYLDVELRFRYYFTRKIVFVRYAAAFAVFPGGFGTLDELFELAVLLQTGRISAPPVVLVGRDYWMPLLRWLREHALAEGKIGSRDLELLALADGVEQVCGLIDPRAP